MTKAEVIQRIIDQVKARVYLEVGVRDGETFLRIRVPKKLGVDPLFLISLKQKLSWLKWNPSNFRARYLSMTSDEFFEAYRDLLARIGLDVVFVDGLHTYHQSLRDIQNSLRYLRPDGVIVVDDCNPQSEIAARPAGSPEEIAKLSLPGWDGTWNGDVWKTIVHLRCVYPDLRVTVLDGLDGVGIVTRGVSTPLGIPLSDVARMTYSDLERDRNRLLNLQPMGSVETILSSPLKFAH
jgi:SAM-dependent methyltransferase